VTEWDELLEQHDRTLAWMARPWPLPEVNLEADMEQLRLWAETDPVDEMRALLDLPPRRPEPDW
jgi:hypothetical protein